MEGSDVDGSVSCKAGIDGKETELVYVVVVEVACIMSKAFEAFEVEMDSALIRSLMSIPADLLVNRASGTCSRSCWRSIELQKFRSSTRRSSRTR